MRFEPIDADKHKKYIVTFRRDSFIVSFGTDKDFGNEEEYLNWVKEKSSEFPDGFVIVLEDGIPIGQLELTIKEYKGNTVGKIVGLAASAASVVAMGVKKLEIAPTAQIMIHRASTYVGGNKDDLQHTADLLDGIDKSIANAYQTKTGIDSNELLDMMTKETWLTAQKAKELGFADAVMFENEEKFLNGTEGSGVLPQSVIDRVRNELTNNKPQNPELEPGLDPKPKPADKDDIEAIKMAIAKAKLKMIMAI